MTSLDTTGTQQALAREWLAVRIIVIGGFLVALLAGLWFGVIYPDYVLPHQQRTLLQNRVQRILGEEAEVCTLALNNAKNFGIVPQYGQLASLRMVLTSVRGRYICAAQTKIAKYFLTLDLQCRDLKSPRCVSLYNIAQPDGTVLYQRQR
ncbi:MAG TPA: hypothetical protein VHU23_14020 [Rhizomicrobium sp.]|jgi:hypothetical protein|nr:hypothetical protein [Rhizomicrobium sp.]